MRGSAKGAVNVTLEQVTRVVRSAHPGGSTITYDIRNHDNRTAQPAVAIAVCTTLKANGLDAFSAAQGLGTRLAQGPGMTHPGTELRRDTMSDLLTATTGAVFVEYVIVLAFAGLMTTLALVAVGPRTVRLYSMQRAALYQPYP